MNNILAIDDDKGTLESIKAIFWKAHALFSAQTTEEARDVLDKNTIDLCLLDIRLYKEDGLTFLEELRRLHPDIPVVIVSGMVDSDICAEATRLGSVDFVRKPFQVKEMRSVVERALSSAVMRRQLEARRRDTLNEGPPQPLLGESPAVRNAVECIRKGAMNHEALMIEGEKGSGMISVAKMIHEHSFRSSGPFISLQCASLPDSLAREEVFGKNDSSNDSNVLASMGRLELAATGTLYLEDVHCLPRADQERLVEILRKGTFIRSAEGMEVRCDVRLVIGAPSGTRERVANGKNDSPIHKELSDSVIVVPPLRERKEDIPLLAYSFLNHFRAAGNAGISSIDSGAMELLRQYSWPGNVKELSNVIESVVYIHGDEKTIRSEFLPRELHSREMASAALATGDRTLEEQVDAFQRGLILDALRRTGGVKKRAASLLGTTSRILNYRIDQLSIETAGK